MNDLASIAVSLIPYARAIVEEKINDLDFLAGMIGASREEVGTMLGFQAWNRVAVIMAKDLISVCESQSVNEPKTP